MRSHKTESLPFIDAYGILASKPQQSFRIMAEVISKQRKERPEVNCFHSNISRRLYCSSLQNEMSVTLHLAILQKLFFSLSLDEFCSFHLFSSCLRIFLGDSGGRGALLLVMLLYYYISSPSCWSLPG